MRESNQVTRCYRLNYDHLLYVPRDNRLMMPIWVCRSVGGAWCSVLVSRDCAARNLRKSRHLQPQQVTA